MPIPFAQLLLASAILAGGVPVARHARRRPERAPPGDRIARLALGLTPALAVVALLSPRSGGPAAALLGLPLFVDAVSLVLLIVVGVLGLVVYRYAARCLLGEPRRDAFLRALAVTVASVEVLLLAGHLLLLAAAWIAASLGLHRLLLHYGERPRAHAAARKKFVISRLGDAALLGATLVLYRQFHTFDLAVLFAKMAQPLTAEESRAVSLAGFGLVLSAMCKSAQVPLQSWLPDTLEAPTPVSALMHAGIVNAGGYLVLRMGPVLAHAPGALTTLVVVGAVTAAAGSVVLWTQTDVKRGLAWSTVSQMGFMMLQCGLGAFAAALVHLVGHSFYKANAFLRSGTLPLAADPPARALPPAAALARLGAGAALALLSATAVLRVTGHAISGATLLLVLVTVLAAAQLLLAPASAAATGGMRALLAVLVSAFATALFVAGEGLFGGQVAEVPDLLARGPSGVFAAAFVALLFVGTTLLYALLPWLAERGAARRLYVHASHGFYVGAVADRLVRWLWPFRPEARS